MADSANVAYLAYRMVLYCRYGQLVPQTNQETHLSICSSLNTPQRSSEIRSGMWGRLRPWGYARPFSRHQDKQDSLSGRCGLDDLTEGTA